MSGRLCHRKKPRGLTYALYNIVENKELAAVHRIRSFIATMAAEMWQSPLERAGDSREHREPKQAKDKCKKLSPQLCFEKQEANFLVNRK